MFNLFYNFGNINKSLFIFINHSVNNYPLITILLKKISQVFFIGNFAVAYLIACIFLYFKTKKSHNKQQYFLPRYNNLVKIGICYALFGFTFAALKFLVNLPRPYCSLSTDEFITIADITKERCLSSFPSAHTGLSILVAYFLWPHLSISQKTLACLMVALVATSRITLALHYPTDILYSALYIFLVIKTGNLLFSLTKNNIIEPIGFKIFKVLFNS